MSFVRKKWVGILISVLVAIYGIAEFVVNNIPSPFSPESKAQSYLTEEYQSKAIGKYGFSMCMQSTTDQNVVDCQLTAQGISRVEKYHAKFSDNQLIIEPYNDSAKKRGWYFVIDREPNRASQSDG